MSDQQDYGTSQAGHMGTGPQGTTNTGSGGSDAVGTQRPGGLQSQTGSDTDGRSPEYRDGLTVQDSSRPAGSSSDWSDTTGARAAGGGTDDSWPGDAAAAAAGSTRPGAGMMGSTAFDTAGNTAGGTPRSASGTASDGPRDHAWGDNIDGAGRDRTDAVTADETGSLISADKVQGTAVYDGSGDRLGTIDSLMLNKRSGKVAYAVMSFGGFLGIGERYHPLPWGSLTYDTDKGGYNVGHTTDILRGGPSYSRDELDEVEGGRRSNEIDDYYGTALGGGLTRSGGVPIV